MAGRAACNCEERGVRLLVLQIGVMSASQPSATERAAVGRAGQASVEPLCKSRKGLRISKAGNYQVTRRDHGLRSGGGV